VKLSNELLGGARDVNLRRAFQNSNVVLALKQPPNLLTQLSRARFTSDNTVKESNGIYKCRRSNCNICKFYLQECTSFIGSNGVEWFIRSRITCQSKKVIYFLKCLCCKEFTTYAGKTNVLRLRTNGHISSCRTGNTTDKFDIHVYNCRHRHGITKEPYFKLLVFVEVFDDKLLLTYESHIHSLGFDAMNT